MYDVMRDEDGIVEGVGLEEIKEAARSGATTIIFRHFLLEQWLKRQNVPSNPNVVVMSTPQELDKFVNAGIELLIGPIS